MRKILAAVLFLPFSALAADMTISSDLDGLDANAYPLYVVRPDETWVIADGITIENFTTTTSNRGGFLSIEEIGVLHVSIGSDVTFQDLHVNNGSGGAINAHSGFSVGNNLTMQNNSSSKTGGAIYLRMNNPNSNGAVSIGSGATFAGNTAAWQGGAIAIDDVDGAALTIGDNATFNGNTAAAGGAIFVGSGSLILGTATFATATDSIYLYGGQTTFSGDITSQSDLTLAGGTLDIGTSALSFAGDVKIFGDSTLAIHINSASDYGTISADSIYVGMGDPDAIIVTLTAGSGPTLQLVVGPNAGQSGSMQLFDSQSASIAFGATIASNPLYNFILNNDGSVGYQRSAMTLGALAATSGAVPYVAQAAGAWDNLPATLTRSIGIQTQLNALAQTNPNAFADAMSTLSHNDSPLLILAALYHIDAALADLASPLSKPGVHCGREYGTCAPAPQGRAQVWARYQNGSADFSSDQNGAFDAGFATVAGGVNLRAGSGAVFGFAVSHTDAIVQAGDIYTTGSANGISLSAKQRAGTFFLNAGGAAGWVDWNERKDVAGIDVDADIRSQFFAAEIDGGLDFGFIAPRIGARYSRVMTNEYADDAGQSFEAWNADALTGLASAEFYQKFRMSGFDLSPVLSIGYAHDFYNGGNDAIGVNVGRNSPYAIPVEWPDASGIFASAGFVLESPGFKITAEWKQEWRSDYDLTAFRVALGAGF